MNVGFLVTTVHTAYLAALGQEDIPENVWDFLCHLFLNKRACVRNSAEAGFIC